ncbi:MAG TPA: GNAT family protein [Candidatus Limnocylindria bacterium]|nr:GNAT family protein [Candidatus Limnocylindria bacterium]
MNRPAGLPWFARLLRMRDEPGDSVRLYTARLLLRAPRMADARQMFAYASDPEVARYVLWEPHGAVWETRLALHGIIARNRREFLHTFAIVTLEDSRMVGTIGLVWRDWDSKSAEVGFSIARDCWGKGLMTEALVAYLRFAFTRLGLHRVEAQHDLRNPASGRVMEKAGMRAEGTLRGRLRYKGDYADVALYSALRDEWLPKHPEPADAGDARSPEQVAG